MSYDVQVFRHEVRQREQTRPDDRFFDHPENLLPFIAAQRQRLHQALLNAGFAEAEATGSDTRYELADPPASALLTTQGLYLATPYSQDGIFEIGMLASELTDTGEFAKYDPQAGGWEDAPA